MNISRSCMLAAVGLGALFWNPGHGGHHGVRQRHELHGQRQRNLLEQYAHTDEFADEPEGERFLRYGPIDHRELGCNFHLSGNWWE